MNPHDLDFLIGLATVGVGVLSGLHWLNQARPRLTLDQLAALERLAVKWQYEGSANADRQIFQMGLELSQLIEKTKEGAQ